jgi:hypothetical protein
MSEHSTPVQSSPWNTSIAKGLLQVALISLSVPSLTSGTASAYPVEVLRKIEDVSRLMVPRQGRREITSLRSVKEEVELIRSVFGLNMSEVAQLFNISRPAAYAWLDGALPKAEAMARLTRIADQAQDAKSAGVTRMAHFVRRPQKDGRSLFQLLKEGADIQDALAAIRKTAEEEEAGRKVSASRKASTKKGDPAGIDEVATPIIPEV